MNTFIKNNRIGVGLFALLLGNFLGLLLMLNKVDWFLFLVTSAIISIGFIYGIVVYKHFMK